jgi:putative phosphoesterase
MKIGIISDTHDHMQRIGKAMEILEEKGVETLIHAGDIVAPFAAKLIRKWPRELYVIYGNNDGERKGLAKVLPQIQDGPVKFELDGINILLAHDEADISQSSTDGIDVVIIGHTHNAGVEKKEKILWINPGEVCGWLTGRPTCAILDTDTMQAEVLELDGGTK